MEKSEKRDTSEQLVIANPFDLIKDYADRTSMHGVKKVFNSERLWKCIVWALLTLCGISLAMYQVTIVIQDFYTSPVVTLVSLQHESHVQFPAITICNLNPIKNSFIPNDTIESILWYQKEHYFEDHEGVNSIIRFIKSKYQDNATHKLKDMLISCEYNRKQCSLKNFTKVNDGIYGACYTFDAIHKEENHITRPGQQNGLILEMAIEYNEYSSLAAQAGVRVIVHAPEEAPFPEDGGILASPGMSSSIAIKKTVTTRLPYPYGNCITETEDRSSDLNLYDSEGYSYTENACRKSCYQLSLIKACNCCDADLPCDDNQLQKILNLEEGQITDYCNISADNSSFTDMYCVYQLETDFYNGNQDCLQQCVPACSQTTYDTAVSTARWPTDSYMEVIWAQANKTVLQNTSFESKDDFKKFVSKNFLKLQIFYEKLDFLEVTTNPMYSWVSVFGNIGGLLGLWLGFSILTAFDIIELCFDMVTLFVKKIPGHLTGMANIN